MKHILITQAICVGLSFGGMTACQNNDCEDAMHPDPSETGTGMPMGCRVVDYTVGEVDSRAYGEHLPASQRISSLLYLLYDADGNLVKERTIPDIGPSTVWPLTREHMTWEQREALKDTLSLGMTYQAMFVANTDPSLFEGESVLDYRSGDDTYKLLENTYLRLPSVPFGDGNQFYVGKQTIETVSSDAVGAEDSGNGTVDRYHPMNCPIRLSRVVSRTDIRREDVPSPIDNTEEYKTYLEERIRTSLYKEAEEDMIAPAVESWTEQLADWVGQAVVGDPDLSFKVIAFQTAIKNKSESIVKAGTSQCLTELTERCSRSATLQRQVTGWENRRVRPVCQDGTEADALSLATLQASHKGIREEAPLYTADGQGLLTLIGFGNGAGSRDLNHLQSLSFYGNEEASDIDFSISLNGEEFVPIGPGANHQITLVCRPLAGIGYKDATDRADFTLTVDLKSLLSDVEHWADFEATVSKVLQENSCGTPEACRIKVPLPRMDETNVTCRATFEQQ